MLTFVALILQLLSPSVFAAGTCTVSALDTVSGLGTQVTVSSCGSNAQALLIVQSPDNQNYTQTITLDGVGNAITLIPSQYTLTAGTYEVTAADAKTTFAVLADHADDAHSTLIVSPQSIDADGRDTATVTAILRDTNDNPVSGRPLALIASRLTDDVTPQSKETDDSGRFLWTVRGTEQGTTSLTVFDIISGRQMKLKENLTVGKEARSPLGASLTDFGRGGETVTADLASETVDRFELSLPQGATDVKANELFGMTIRAMKGGEVSRGYIGALTVKSSDPDALLPRQGEDPRNPSAGHIEMRGVDQGERKVPLAFMLRSSGMQTIEITDDLDPTFAGKLTLNVIRSGGSGNDKIVIVDPQDRTSVKGGPILLQGRAPSLINLKVKGGNDIVNGESDEEGVFRISVPINPADKEVTLFVTSENGAYESNPVHILIDNVAPAIETINLDPAEAKAGERTTITVKSEAGLSAVTAAYGTETITLSEGSGGLYSGILSAPKLPGIYDITASAKDGAGNSSAMLTKWKVSATTLPIVQNVTAEGKQNAVSVQWQAVQGVDNIRQYKIYIAAQNDPQNILYSIGTNKPVTSAIIKDLPLGISYLFSLTVVAEDGTESPEKSAPASATPYGFSLTVTPGKDSLLLEWTPIPSLPLDHYVLEYGTSPGEYPGRQKINGSARSTILRDLLGGVTYEVKLTPVTVTGKTMTESAVIAHGTPTSDGFVAGTSESVPSDFFGGLHPGAPLDRLPSLDEMPSTTESGIPSFTLGLVIVAALGIGLHWQRAQREKKKVDAFLQAMQQRYLS